jgi:hypothetical protein
MHLGGSLDYQFDVTSSREMMRDLMKAVSSPPTEAMAAS